MRPYHISRWKGAGGWLGLALLVLGVAAAVVYRADALYADQADPALVLEVPRQVEMGQPIRITVTVQNAVDIGGYELTLLYDPAALTFSGLRQRNNDIRAMGRDIGPLGPVERPSGAIFGLYSCPFANCVYPAAASPRQTGGASGTVRLADLSLTPNVTGTVEIKLGNALLVSAAGVPVSVTLPSQSWQVQVGPTATGPLYAAPAPDINPVPQPPTAPAGPFDLTGDGLVNYADSVQVTIPWTTLRERGLACGDLPYPERDVNHDACLNVADLQMIADHYSDPPGAATPSPEPSATATAEPATPSPTPSGTVTVEPATPTPTATEVVSPTPATPEPTTPTPTVTEVVSPTPATPEPTATQPANEGEGQWKVYLPGVLRQPPLATPPVAKVAPRPPDARESARAYALDSFDRPAAAGWRSADIGGAYSLWGPLGDFRLTGSAASITLPFARAERRAELAAVNALNVDATFRLKTDKYPTGNGQYAIFESRQAGADVYLSTLRLTDYGGAELYSQRVVNGEATVLGPVMAVPTLVYAPNRYLWVRVQVEGRATTRLRMRVWADGQPEPWDWQYEVMDTTGELQTPGAVGLRTYLAGSATNAPVVFTFDDLKVVDASAP